MMKSKPVRKRRFRTRPRKSGFAVAVILVLVLLAAWNTGNNLLYIVVGGLASFGMISTALAWWSFRNLKITRVAPEAVHRGDGFAVTVRIENLKRLMPAVSVRLESHAQPGISAGYVARIPPRRAAIVRITETLPRRGVHRLPGLTLATTFPFGLLERRMLFEDETEVTVYPRIVPVRASYITQAPGNRNAPRSAIADGDEFFSIREYVLGDDPRRIAWRQSARTGKLMVRELSRQHSKFIVFMLDSRLLNDDPQYMEYLEEAIELAASFAVVLLNRQYTVAICATNDALPPGETKGHQHKTLEFLARLHASPNHRVPFVVTPNLANLAYASYVFLSPDPEMWGRPAPFGGSRILDPREVVRA